MHANVLTYLHVCVGHVSDITNTYSGLQETRGLRIALGVRGQHRGRLEQQIRGRRARSTLDSTFIHISKNYVDDSFVYESDVGGSYICESYMYGTTVSTVRITWTALSSWRAVVATTSRAIVSMWMASLGTIGPGVEDADRHTNKQCTYTGSCTHTPPTRTHTKKALTALLGGKPAIFPFYFI